MFEFNIPIEKLKEKFEVTAIFYKDEEENLCRKNCQIVRKGIVKEPEAIIVMMNPGSCKAIGEYKENERCSCKMDPTQKQLAILMEYAKLDCIQIENLSDICSGSSTVFWDTYNSMKGTKSIFGENRIKEIGNLNVPIIYAWGKSAMGMANKIDINNSLQGKKVFGYKKEGTDYYQRPLYQFMKAEDKEAWIRVVGDYLKES